MVGRSLGPYMREGLAQSPPQPPHSPSTMAAAGSTDVAPPGSAEDTAKAAWTALRHATEAELPRYEDDRSRIPDLARLIAVDENELLVILRNHSELFYLCTGGERPWHVNVVPLACEMAESQR